MSKRTLELNIETRAPMLISIKEMNDESTTDINQVLQDR